MDAKPLLTVHADPELCCSSGQCAAAVPEVFDQDDADGRVLLLQPRPPAALADAVREAAYCCPAGAITVTEEPAPPTDPAQAAGAGGAAAAPPAEPSDPRD